MCAKYLSFSFFSALHCHKKEREKEKESTLFHTVDKINAQENEEHGMCARQGRDGDAGISRRHTPQRQWQSRHESKASRGDRVQRSTTKVQGGEEEEEVSECVCVCVCVCVEKRARTVVCNKWRTLDISAT